MSYTRAYALLPPTAKRFGFLGSIAIAFRWIRVEDTDLMKELLQRNSFEAVFVLRSNCTGNKWLIKLGYSSVYKHLKYCTCF